MLKNAVRQQRHKLKKKYFDGCPLNQVRKTSPLSWMTKDQWDGLVDYWKSEKKMVTCEKNKSNRSQVQFHQKTGSRSYEMQLTNLASKYQNEPPNALDIFKDLHYSKKKGFTPTVQSAIVEMEDMMNAPVNDGEEPKDVVDVVSEVLLRKTKKSSFLVNVGIKSSFAGDGEENAESQHELEAELAAEKQASNELRELVKNQQLQLDDMKNKFQEAEKKQAETQALIRGLMSMIK